MDTPDTLNEKIDKLFESHLKDNPDSIKLFVEKLTANHQDVGKKLFSRLSLFILSYIATLFFHYGYIEEVSIASIKIKAVRLLLLYAPPLIGLFFHQFVSTFSAVLIFQSALKRCYLHLLPDAYLMDLEQLVVPANMFDTSILLTNKLPGFFKNIMIALFLLIMFGLPMIFMFHCGYLMLKLPVYRLWIEVLSWSIGIILCLHAYSMLVGAFRLDLGTKS